jgi:hypothetical protein
MLQEKRLHRVLADAALFTQQRLKLPRQLWAAGVE